MKLEVTSVRGFDIPYHVAIRLNETLMNREITLKSFDKTLQKAVREA